MNTRFGLKDKRIAVIRDDHMRARAITAKLNSIGARILEIPPDGPGAPPSHPFCESLDGIVVVSSPSDAPPPPTNEASIQQAFAVHYVSPVHQIVRLVSAGALNSGASIVFIVSLDAQVVRSDSMLHSGAMAALVTSAKCLALELAPKRIRVNCLCPPPVKSTDAETGRKDELVSHSAFTALDEAIADTTAYFLCDASRWVTGQALPLGQLTNA